MLFGVIRETDNCLQYSVSMIDRKKSRNKILVKVLSTLYPYFHVSWILTKFWINLILIDIDAYKIEESIKKDINAYYLFCQWFLIRINLYLLSSFIAPLKFFQCKQTYFYVQFWMTWISLKSNCNEVIKCPSKWKFESFLKFSLINANFVILLSLRFDKMGDIFDHNVFVVNSKQSCLSLSFVQEFFWIDLGRQ